MKKEDKVYVFKKIFRFTFISLFVIYMAIFISDSSGYYSFSLKNRKELTDAQIIKFEEDVKNGIEIDVSEYLEVDSISYQNNTSRLGLVLSNSIENIVKNGVYKIFEFFSDLMESPS